MANAPITKTADDSKDANLTAIMRREGIRSIHMHPDGFTVILQCGWPCGYGDTVGEALADAKAKHERRAA